MLTSKQRELRKGHLGASDTAALFGLDPFKTGADVWMSKCFDTDEVELKSESVELGNDFEAPLLRWAAEELGVKLSGDPDSLFAVSETHPIFSATLDERIIGLPEGVEAKTSGKVDEWGEPGTDQVPDRTLIQCQQGMFVHGLKRMHIPVLLGRNGLTRAMFHVERNEDIIKAIIEKGTDFWNNYVIPKVQPPEEMFGLGNLEIIKRIQRTPQTWAEVPDELIDDWDAKRKARLDAERAEKEALERMLTPLKDAEGVKMSDGRVLEYYPTTRNFLDQKSLKAEQPGTYHSYLKQNISRTPRIKGGAD